MAIQVLYDADILLGAYDLSGDHNKVNLSLTQDTKEVTVFGDVARKSIAGIMDIKADSEGFLQFSDTPQAIEKTLFGRGGVNLTGDVMTVGHSKADGDTAYIFKGVQEGFNDSAALGEPGKFTVSSMGAYKFVRGTRLVRGSKTTTGNGTAYLMGLLSAGQTLYALLHVYAWNATNLVVKVQSDDAVGFPSSADRITFTTATGLTSEWKELAGPVATDTYWRAAWTLTGTSASISVVIGIV